MKRQLLLLWLLIAVVASMVGPPGPTRLPSPVRVDGLQLGMEDQQVQARLGPELPGSDCPPQGNHRHWYGGGTEVYFSKQSFLVEAIEGRLLEFYSPSQGWTPLVRAGDPADAILFPSRLPLQERSGWLNRQVLSDFHPGEATTSPLGPWVSYRYASEAGEMCDGLDFDIVVQRTNDNRVARIQVVWQGH